ncbi:hypothetical protein CKO23_11170 [Thiocystis violacea]|nr:hypothetical protein [Thiocystis violacea]
MIRTQTIINRDRGFTVRWSALVCDGCGQPSPRSYHWPGEASARVPLPTGWRQHLEGRVLKTHCASCQP